VQIISGGLKRTELTRDPVTWWKLSLETSGSVEMPRRKQDCPKRMKCK